jgi:hypothetical protein
MSDKPKKLVVDLATGKQEYIELTTPEINQRDTDAQAAETQRREAEAAATALAAIKASAKAKLMSGQRLTEEEASVITL